MDPSVRVCLVLKHHHTRREKGEPGNHLTTELEKQRERRASVQFHSYHNHYNYCKIIIICLGIIIIIVGERLHVYTFIHCHKFRLHALSQDYLYLYTVDVWFDEATGERDNEKRKRITEYVTYDFRASPIFGQVQHVYLI